MTSTVKTTSDVKGPPLIGWSRSREVPSQSSLGGPRVEESFLVSLDFFVFLVSFYLRRYNPLPPTNIESNSRRFFDFYCCNGETPFPRTSERVPNL